MFRLRSSLARGFRVYLNIILLLSTAVLSVLVLSFVVSPLVMAKGSLESDAAIAVLVGSGSLRPVLHIDTPAADEGAVRNPRVLGARGELRFVTPHWRLQFLANLGLLVGAVMTLLGIVLVRNMLREVEGGRPFGHDNGRRLRALGALFLAAGLLRPMIEYALVQVVLSRLGASQPPMSPPRASNERDPGGAASPCARPGLGLRLGA